MAPTDDGGKQREALLSAMLAAVPDFVAHVDDSGRILYANHAQTPGGLPVVIGGSWLDIVTPANRERAALAVVEVIASRAPVTLESRVETADGGIAIFVTKVAPVIVDGLVTGVLAITRDVTSDKLAEAQMMRSDRTSSIGALAAGVAHEINNPLSVVIANLQLAQRRIDKVGDQLVVPEVALAELRDAADCADQVAEIVRDLEVFSRSSGEHPGPVDVHRVIEATLRVAWSEVRHRAQIVRELGEVPPVRANPAQLGQLLLDLILNAAQSIDDGNYAGNTIRIATSVDGSGRVAIAIRDSGRGIAPTMRHRIFAPFFTDRSAGVGLGLSVVRRIVDALGGELDFTSTPGVGTEFTVRLPAAVTPAAEPEPPAPPAPSEEPRRGRVLVIDDDPLVVRTIKRILANHHEVITTDNGEAGLALIAAGDRFDVILCDLMMPNLTGMEVLAELETRAPDQAARMVFVSGGAFTPQARDFLASDRYRRLDKPFGPQTLRATVDEVMRAHR